MFKTFLFVFFSSYIKNEVGHHESFYSLANVKLNQKSPLSDSDLNSQVTSLRLEIPSSNDPVYAIEVFDKIGASVKKIHIEKLGDKTGSAEFRELMLREIPPNFLKHFPQLTELCIKYTHDLDTIKYYPVNLKCLNIQYFHSDPSEKFLENIQKIRTLKVLKANEISMSRKTDVKSFVKLDATLSLELKKFLSTEWNSDMSICTEANLLTQESLQIADVTGILIEPINKWNFESFDGLVKFLNLQIIRISLHDGHGDRCLFPHAKFTLPSVKEVCLEGQMGKVFCDTCFLNLIQMCPNVTSMILKETFNVNSVHKVLTNFCHLETFRCKSFRLHEKLEAEKFSKLETLEMTLSWDEVENWPEMPQLKKLVVAVRLQTKIVPFANFLKKCPNLTSFKISSFEAGGLSALYVVSQIIAKSKFRNVS